MIAASVRSVYSRDQSTTMRGVPRSIVRVARERPRVAHRVAPVTDLRLGLAARVKLERHIERPKELRRRVGRVDRAFGLDHEQERRARQAVYAAASSVFSNWSRCSFA